MRRLLVAALLVSLFAVNAVQAQQQVPEKKQTSLGLYVTAKEAYEKWEGDPENVKIIDVRTPEEFRLIGFPEMAARIPLSASDAFVGQVKKIAKPDDTILVICRSGNRSAVAVDILARAGFERAFTVVDGFEGDRNTNPSSPDYGKRTVNGWKNAGLPWTYRR